MTELQDSHNFLLPEEFFQSVKRGEFKSPAKIVYNPEDNLAGNPVIKTGVLLRLQVDGQEEQPLFLLQFARPKVWRIRFDPDNLAPEQYDDYNSRTIISDTLSNLIKILDCAENIIWRTEFDAGSDLDSFYIFKTVQYPTKKDLKAKINGRTITELNIYKNGFKIEAVRSIEESGLGDPPILQGATSKAVFKRKVVWETTGAGLSWKKTGTANATLLTAKKPGSARYLGWGEQGGKEFLKKSTLMNYFNFDNMTYSSVYNQGPLDEREPLYHSEPFWLEINGLPNYKSQVATFVDNYSQICVDFSLNNPSQINVGTRFGPLQYFVFAGDSVADIISLYSSVMGRARLKPRYVLGHHQGCYGYDTRKKVLKVAHAYKDRDIPLDGIHIDVDLQDGLRTFTIDADRKFPRPKEMFDELRSMGVKCSTNITPVINLTPTETYKTLNEGLEKGHFILDKRYDDGNGVIPPHEVEYVCYENGIKLNIDPVNEMGQFPGADYDFVEWYNSGKPYRGGVGYGGTLGAPGYYPNLNNAETRKWWGEQYQYLFDQGLEFIWQDMTTPAIAKEYGDMKGLPFRLMVDSDQWSGEATEPMKPALEIWALYSYNLHKATYEGLNVLKGRENKRNFIIGRGSYAGAHKWAGLWTGDNASTWDHFQISVNQVLSLGISGNEVVGADVGGFMPAAGFANEGPRYAEPELVIRWYCAYSLLPWFRNHYHGKRGMKLFQEPYAFTDHYNSNPSGVPEQDRSIWLAVEPVCRYYVKLRYSLLQLMYDAMFEHQFHGLPIARALLITDSEDTSLFADNDWALSNEYVVGRDLLVAPIMHKQDEKGGHRSIYFPQQHHWYRLNLRTDGSLGVPLGSKITGGTKFDVDATISVDESYFPYIAPMFVRGGGIIPQIEVRQSADDKSKVNPVTLHLYPGGKKNTYRMFLDDGVSRQSAPTKKGYKGEGDTEGRWADSDMDKKAKNEFREVKIEQEWNVADLNRTITITTPWDGYHLDRVQKDIGDHYTVVIWHDEYTDVTEKYPEVVVSGSTVAENRNDISFKASVVKVPVDIPQGTGKVVISVAY